MSDLTELHDWLRGRIDRLRIEAAHGMSDDTPSEVLAQCEAHTALLGDLLTQRHHVCDGDPWYTCAAATEDHDGGTTARDDVEGCDCGRDAEVERRVRQLAVAYRHHTGYQPQWRP